VAKRGACMQAGWNASLPGNKKTYIVVLVILDHLHTWQKEGLACKLAGTLHCLGIKKMTNYINNIIIG